MKNRQEQHWYHQRVYAALIAVAALLAAYGLASLAIDSGSLSQYLVAIALSILAINRCAHVIKLTVASKLTSRRGSKS